MNMDELDGILTSYEMIKGRKKSKLEDEPFKELKKTKGHKDHNHFNSKWDKEKAKFVRRMKRGCGKYKGKTLFKCFECGIIVHYSSKLPYAKNGR